MSRNAWGERDEKAISCWLLAISALKMEHEFIVNTNLS